MDVFGLGQCSLDYVGMIEGFPPADSKCEFSSMVIQGGGPVATALVALARWGRRCFFAGVIGDDRFGGEIRASLAEEGVDTGGLLVRRGEPSQFAFIAAEPSAARRTIFWQRPTGKPPGPGEVDTGRLAAARVFHTDGLFVEAALHAAGIARSRGVPVVVDAGTLRDGMLELAGRADAFIASETFARALAGGDDPLGACRRLAELGPSVVAVTLGAEGYVGLLRGEVLRKPAHRAVVLDTTGCGDVFHGGFIHGLLGGWDAERCLDLGNWAAARVSTRLGGRAGIPSRAELRAAGFE